MGDDYVQETGAPFNMAIATLMSLRGTLDKIRDIEGRIDFPPEERQRIKIELVKRFYVDSAPLIFDKTILDQYSPILETEPQEVICISRRNDKKIRKTKYDRKLNQKLDKYLLDLQVELQKKKYYMPPKDDMGSIGGKMH